jgi:hypothetical protein
VQHDTPLNAFCVVLINSSQFPSFTACEARVGGRVFVKARIHIAGSETELTRVGSLSEMLLENRASQHDFS